MTAGADPGADATTRPEPAASGDGADAGADAAPVSTGPQSLTPRDADLILARAHLRFGLLSLARAELETMAGRNLLDDDGIRDLAEARWRTGDTSGAGEAAAAYLEASPDDLVALVIAAEAQAELGRPGEARRLAGRALELADGSLDPIFAGMRRHSIWPADPGTTIGPVGVLFDELHPSPIAPAPSLLRRASDRPLTNGGPPAPFDPALPAEFEAGPGLWDDDPEAALSADAGAEVDPAELFARARDSLDHGQTAAAATGLILAMRSSPELAPAVLDLLSGRSEPILVLVRSDAHEIVGREGEAQRDRVAAATGVGADRTMAAPMTPVDGEPVEPLAAGPAAEPLAVGPADPDPGPESVATTPADATGTTPADTVDPNPETADPSIDDPARGNGGP
ncbi:MAG TPA: hypothetical protein VH440_06550 [Candidatus Limnocylindrales bacterium]